MSINGTLIQHYLREAPKKSSAAALEAANAVDKSRKKEEEIQKTKAEMGRLEKQHREELTQKDEQLEQARQQVCKLQEELIQVYKHGVLTVASSVAPVIPHAGT